MDYLAV